MCSVPPKFFQVCRLCLVLIEENDISAHRIYNSNSLSSGSCKKVVNNNGGSSNFLASESVGKCKNCVKFRDEDIKNQLKESTHSSLPRVPFSTKYFQIYSKNIAIDNNFAEVHEHEIDAPPQSFPMFNVASELPRGPFDVNSQNSTNKTDGPTKKFLDETMPNISVQILNCLSLEVLSTDGLPDLVCCNCKSYLETFWNFRTMAHRTNAALKDFLKLCRSSDISSADIDICFNDLLNSSSSYKSTSEQMAAKALTELSSFSRRNCFLRGKLKRNKTPIIFQNSHGLSSENNDKQKDLPLNTIDLNLNECHKSSEKIQCLQQQLETAAVLMDISKKVIISPPCSNPQSPSICPSVESSILSSVIQKNDLPNDNYNSELNLTKKSSTCDLRNFVNFNIQDKSLLSQSTYLEPEITEINKLENSIKSKSFYINEKNISPSNSDCQLNPRRFNLESDRKTPDSLTSEEHGTDAATTQLWQALARSAANNTNCNGTTQLLNILNTSFAYPTGSLISSACETVPDEPIALLKSGNSETMTKKPDDVYVSESRCEEIYRDKRVCDHKLEIRYIQSHSPGSCHDSLIWNVSDLKQHLKEEYENGHMASWRCWLFLGNILGNTLGRLQFLELRPKNF